MKKVLNVIGNILVTLVLIFSVVLTITVISSTRNEYRVPSLFGYAIMSVQTNSMESENGFYVGDLIVVRMIEYDEANDLHVGDVITFLRMSDAGENYLETHRIVENTYESTYAAEVVDGIRIHGGQKAYVTKGDNTPLIDTNRDGTPLYALPKMIIGVWEGMTIPKIGAAMDFLRSQIGFMICVVIPVLLFFIYELYVFIMTLTRKQKERTLAEVADKEAELKAKAVAEFLAQQQAYGGATTPPAANDAPDTAAQAASLPAPEKPAESSPADPAETVQKAPAPSADDAKTPDISEAEKQRIIQEYLAKQQAENNE